MRWSSSEIFDLQADAIQFANWNANEADTDFTGHTKNCIAVAMQKELTETQRLYFSMYFIDGKGVSQIANEVGVNKSTVSRTLKAAKKNLARVLVYTAPHLLNAQFTERNRRIKDGN